MKSVQPRLIYLLFLFSGLAGLIYEIVWGRLLMLTFGNTTQSMVAVITAFLGGLGLGSLIAGRISDRFEAKRLIQIYALLEVGVGLTAAATLLLLPLIRTVYASFSDGSTVSAGLLVTKFLLAVAVLIVPTTLMGGTLPVLSRWVNLQHRGLAAAVSWLYAFNTLGATLGVMLSTVVLIERYGLSSTVLIAAGINILVGLASLAIAGSGDSAAARVAGSPAGKSAKQSIDIVPVLVYSLSGLIGITCQVLWTRFLTQSVGTFVYAFAIILSTYLLGIMIGSLLYPALARLVPSRTIALGICQFGAGIMTLASMFLGNLYLTISPFLMVVLVILPATIFMGLSFPATVALLDEESAARSVGLDYFGNNVV
jgi:spermidine synthase